MSEVEIVRGFSSTQLMAAVDVYDAAFGGKVGLAIPEEARRRAVLRRVLAPEFALAALRDGELVGLLGFHDVGGSFTGGGGWEDLREELGLLDSARAAIVLSMFERKPTAGQLLLDGIAVPPEARGQGIGSRLIDGVLAYARERGLESVRLDVIDTNEGARRLYERKGFEATHTERFEWLRGTLGFGATTTMVFPIERP